MDECRPRLSPISVPQTQIRFVHDQLDTIPTDCPIAQPKTEPDVHRPAPVAVRHPLDDDSSRRREFIQQRSCPFEIHRAKFAENGMDGKSSSNFALRAPHMDVLSSVGQSGRQLPGVAGHPTEVRWILGRDQMNYAHSFTWVVPGFGPANWRAMKMRASGAIGTSTRDSDVPTCSRISGHALKTYISP